MENKYLEKLLDQKFDSLEKLIDSKFNQNEVDHKRIELQVKKTNGRVSMLEKWRWGMSGAITLLAGILGAIGFQLKLIF